MNDPAMINSGYERLENDAYYTRDIVCMDALIWGLSETPLLTQDTIVWEPFAGGGHISNFLSNRDIHVVSTDINPQHENCEKLDYFGEENTNDQYFPKGCNGVITNPPFDKKLAENFVRDMIKKCSQEKPFTACVFLRNEWDSAGTRLDIFDSIYFDRKIVITQRPKWMKVTKDSKSPRHNYAWFVFTNKRLTNDAKIVHYHPSKDTANYEKVGRKYKRKYTETGLEYIY